MTIPVFTKYPNSLTSPSTFASDMDTMISEYPAFISGANAQAAAIDATAAAFAAGTAIGIPYIFSTTTTDADPGAGYLRLDNATQNTATTIRADLVGADGTTWTDVLATFDDSDSAIKGNIMLQKISDATKWILFSVSSIATPAGYRNIAVAVIGSSAASPFANNDSVVLKFTRAGDKGDKGDAGSTSAASQAQAEAGTDNTVAITPLSTNWHPGVAKAWCNASGDGLSILASWNITSITDEAAGHITFTIATDFSSANYDAHISTVKSAFAGYYLMGVAQSAGAYSAEFGTGSTNLADPNSWHFVAFGDQ